MKIRAPSGDILTFPDNASAAQVAAFLSRRFGPGTPWEAYVRGQQAARSGVAGAIEANEQNLARSVPGWSEATAAIPTAIAAVEDAIADRHGPNDGWSGEWKKVRANQSGQINQFTTDHPWLAGAARMTGDAVQAVPFLAFSGLGAADKLASPAATNSLTSLASRLSASGIRNAITGAMISATNAAAQPGGLNERMGNAAKAIPLGAAIGASAPAFSALGEKISASVASAISPNLRLLVSQGLPTSWSKILSVSEEGYSAKLLDDIQSLGNMDRLRNVNIGTFNRWIANQSLAHIGQTVPDEVKSGGQLLAYLSKSFDLAEEKATKGVRRAIPDDEFVAALNRHMNGFADQSDYDQDRLRSIIWDDIIYPILDGPEDGTEIPGIKQKIESLSQNFKVQRGVSDPLALAIDGAGQDITDMVGRQNPGYASSIRHIEAGRAILARMRQASDSPGTVNGMFTPAQLESTIEQSIGELGKYSLSPGDQLIYELAKRSKDYIYSSAENESINGKSLYSLTKFTPIDNYMPKLSYDTSSRFALSRELDDRPPGSTIDDFLDGRQASINPVPNFRGGGQLAIPLEAMAGNRTDSP